ncbi:hypothetical protein [Caballeronia sp. LjRoot31]
MQHAVRLDRGLEEVSYVPVPAFFRLPVALEDGAGAFARGCQR